MTVRNKLKLSFSLVLFLLMVVCFVSVYNLISSTIEYNLLFTRSSEIINNTQDLQKYFNSQIASARSYLLTYNPRYVKDFNVAVDRAEKNIIDIGKLAEQEEEKKILAELQIIGGRYSELIDLDLVVGKEYQKVEEFLYNLVKTESLMIITAEILVNLEKDLIEKSRKEMQSQIFKTVGVIIFLFIIALITAIVRSGKISNEISSSVEKISVNVKQVASGNLEVRPIVINSRDEFEPLSKDINLMTEQLRENIRNIEELNQAYFRYVPEEFLNFLGKSDIRQINKGEQVQMEMAIMFSDIRSFTSISESLTAQETFDFIDDYLSAVAPCVRNNKGFIDKYIGDGIMALYPGEAETALKSSVDIIRSLKTFNAAQRSLGKKEISIGIGIHTGRLILGVIGESERLSSTVISDAVNLSSRLEGLTKIFGTAIIISEDLMAKLDPAIFINTQEFSSSTEFSDDSIFYRYLDIVKVKGKNTPVKIFEIISDKDNATDMKKIDTHEEYSKAIKLYQTKEFQKAENSFKEILSKNPNDKTSAFYLEKCVRLLKTGVDSDWSFVETMFEK